MSDIAYDKFLRGCGWLALAIVAALVMMILFMRLGSGEFVSLPNDHDARLVGWWQGRTFIESDIVPELPPSPYYLSLDGSGRAWDAGVRELRFQWGTEGNRFQIKRMATDSWDNSKFEFSVSPDGRTMTLTGRKHYMIAPKWTRLDSRPANLRPSGG